MIFFLCLMLLCLCICLMFFVFLGSMLSIIKVWIECLVSQVSNFMCLLCVTIVFLENILYLM
jgi:hypothetical protein